MDHVAKWSKKSPLRSHGWYYLACNLINMYEAKAIETKYVGGGSKECLQKVLQKWMNTNPEHRRSWGVIVTALEGIDETEVVDQIISTQKL